VSENLKRRETFIRPQNRKNTTKTDLGAVTLLGEENIELAHGRLEGLSINMIKNVKMAILWDSVHFSLGNISMIRRNLLPPPLGRKRETFFRGNRSLASTMKTAVAGSPKTPACVPDYTVSHT
jgi:hypothetical protein